MSHASKADMIWEMDRANARAKRRATVLGVLVILFLLGMAALAVAVA